MQKLLVLLCWTTSFAVLNYGAKHVVQSLPPVSSEPRLLAGHLLGSAWAYVLLLLYATCVVLYLVALRLMPLSVAGPAVTILGALTTFALGMIFFHETITPARVAGILLCLSGVALLFRPA